jgi:hypothetical protein
MVNLRWLCFLYSTPALDLIPISGGNPGQGGANALATVICQMWYAITRSVKEEEVNHPYYFLSVIDNA